MKRIAITDYSGKWFDLEKAQSFKEQTYHNGSNPISKATGSQYEHEGLYLTVSKVWVLNRWSQWQGSQETYQIIDKNKAVVWFLRQSMDLPEELKGLDTDYEI